MAGVEFYLIAYSLFAAYTSPRCLKIFFAIALIRRPSKNRVATFSGIYILPSVPRFPSLTILSPCSHLNIYGST